MIQGSYFGTLNHSRCNPINGEPGWPSVALLRSPRRTIFGRSWGKSGQTSILARTDNDVNDPDRTSPCPVVTSKNHGDANGILIAFRAHVRRLRCDVSPKPLVQRTKLGQ